MILSANSCIIGLMEDSHIDIYCERMDASLWAEPLNALTNLAFLIAAFSAFRFWRAKGSGEKDILLLILVLGSVGIGSFLFHTFAQPWSLLADVLPIAVFIHLAIFSASIRVFGARWWWAIIYTIAFANLSYYWETNVPAELLNGSVTYLPALFALITMSILAKTKGLQAAIPFFTATILLISSLTFRSLDMAACDITAGIGTHFMWHILNGLLMFKVIKALLLGNLVLSR